LRFLLVIFGVAKRYIAYYSKSIWKHK